MKNRIKTAVCGMLREAGFDRKKHRQANPALNSDSVSVKAAYLVQLHDAINDMPKPTKNLPFTLEQVQRRKDKDGFIKAVLLFTMEELGVSVDCLNDAVSETILSDLSGLEDIGYKPVGVDGDGNVLVEVTGDVSSWLERLEEPDEE